VAPALADRARHGPSASQTAGAEQCFVHAGQQALGGGRVHDRLARSFVPCVSETMGEGSIPQLQRCGGSYTRKHSLHGTPPTSPVRRAGLTADGRGYRPGNCGAGLGASTLRVTRRASSVGGTEPCM
jgi:hypothetical protein